MCGITGLVERPGVDIADALRGMIGRLAHRGPDDCGVQCWPEYGVGLAHRRLSVIDLTAAAHQPMIDGVYAIAYNGEIYNFHELRRQLVDRGLMFRSHSDTEVVLKAYGTWGLESVHRLRGMFAFAIWDAAERRLLLARDRLGIKPLYYFERGGLFAFASEPKALLAHPAISARVDPSALADFLTYGYVPYDRSIFQGVRKLPAGHVLINESGASRLVEYWRFTPPRTAVAAPTAEELRGKVAEAVGQHLVSDVPITTFLSGGIDSSVVTALVARSTDTPIDTMAVGFDDDVSELPYARDVSSACATRHHEEQVGVGGVDQLIRALAHAFDEPLADTSAAPTFLLCRAAARDFKVAVSGDGGDELFAGYRRYGRMLRPLPSSAFAAEMTGHLRSVPKLARAQVLLRSVEPDPLRRYHLHAGLFDDWESARLAGAGVRPAIRGRDALWLFRKFFDPALPLLTALQWLDVKTYLADDILVKVDRASMAHSLEVRPPLLDHEVVELAFHIPASKQRDREGGKAFFKRATADLLPRSVLQRGKRGFSPPTTAWFKRALWPIARARIVNGYCDRDGLINARFVDRMVANYSERRWAKVWALWMLEEWYRRWIIGNPG